MTGGQEIKVPFCWNFEFFLVIILSFSSCFFAFIAFGNFFFQFQDKKASLKQAPGHDHKNTMFQLGQRPF